MYKKNFLAICATTVTLAISGCGGSGGSSTNKGVDEKPSGETGSEGSTSKEISHTLSIVEHESVTAAGASLRTKYDDLQSILKLQSDGFPNQIMKLTTSSGKEITEFSEIIKLFNLYVNPISGEVEVKIFKELDFEQDDSFYLMDIRLGSKTIKLRLNVYDIQEGTAEEPLVISSYNELKSYAAGKFVSDNIGFDVIRNLPPAEQNLRALGETGSSVEGRKGLHIKFDRDIDASESQNDPWQAIEHIGSINGAGYVIKNLNMEGFISNPTRFHVSGIRNLGFVDAKTNATVINIASGGISKVFFEGVYTSGASAYFAPFTVSGRASQIYSNAYYDISAATADVRLSGLLNASSSSVYMDSAYSNGSISPRTFQGAQGINVAGLSNASLTLDLLSTNYQNKTVMYSAIKMDFDMVNRSYTYQGLDVTDHRYGGLGGASADYPENIKAETLASNRSDYQWKFVNNRSQSPMIIKYGNLRRDTDINSNLPKGGPDVSAAAISEAELMQASMFTGEWGSSHFDVQDGEYPVLKGMPYPHEEGASWMSAEDPGVAYQRATYNKYQTAP